ncbi:MAG: hypothetical protein JWQ95_1222 [Sphaerisporangium sp.]|nr:hypothetical protein [Sphaerisporangium sp.]
MTAQAALVRCRSLATNLITQSSPAFPDHNAAIRGRWSSSPRRWLRRRPDSGGGFR